MTTSRLRDLDSRAWSVATWLAPLMTQIVLALVIVGSWLLGKWFPGTAGAVLFLAGAAATFIVCALAVLVLARSRTPRARGIALSIAGSYAVVVVGGVIYGLWIIQW